MPRDLLAEKQTLDSMPQLSREPQALSPEPAAHSSLVPHRSSNIAQEERLKQMGVRPYSSLLNIDDLDDCDWLEHAAFDPIEAATREKVKPILHAPLAFLLSCVISPSTDIPFFASPCYHASGCMVCNLCSFLRPQRPYTLHHPPPGTTVAPH